MICLRLDVTLLVHNCLKSDVVTGVIKMYTLVYFSPDTLYIAIHTVYIYRVCHVLNLDRLFV